MDKTSLDSPVAHSNSSESSISFLSGSSLLGDPEVLVAVSSDVISLDGSHRSGLKGQNNSLKYSNSSLVNGSVHNATAVHDDIMEDSYSDYGQSECAPIAKNVSMESSESVSANASFTCETSTPIVLRESRTAICDTSIWKGSIMPDIPTENISASQNGTLKSVMEKCSSFPSNTILSCGTIAEEENTTEMKRKKSDFLE